MATPIKERSKLEVRAVVRFLFSKGTKVSEIHKQIAETYGEGAMSRSRVYQWCTWFGEGRTSLGDEPKSGRRKTSTNEENTTPVDELIRCDRRMNVREIALKLEIPKRYLLMYAYPKLVENLNLFTLVEVKVSTILIEIINIMDTLTNIKYVLVERRAPLIFVMKRHAAT
ncbi:histone-lysine N-methyltransferase SETMAR [Plakobranchus ocellatus]|uniref:Histone-lysine N-methyltransferase SETMAR n=1 Tax=Plakobranchus ocellatus TaxID=259542 RepID=A0AAV4D4V9_9GAST|nr:histone-lysine N-methyltransferase SETMAR [Plakobranchus ocellatus]